MDNATGSPDVPAGWEWLDPYELSIEWQLATASGTATWEAAEGFDGAIIDAAERSSTDLEKREAWTGIGAMRRRAQTEAMLTLFYLHSEFGFNPEKLQAALASIVADAVTAAEWLGWESKRSSISAKVRTLVYRRDGYACLECGSDDVTRLTIDHRQPVSLGGSDDPSNLRTLCKSCNSSKGAQL